VRGHASTSHFLPLTSYLRDGGGSGLVVWPVFKTAMEAPTAAPVGSIPTRSRHLACMARCAVLVFMLSIAVSFTLSAQAAPPPRRPAVGSDTLQRSYISPFNAFWRSFLIPGWGQARLNRKLTGGIFVAWEGLTLGMSLKTRQELRYLRRNNSSRGDAKRQEHEDWLVLLGFNHLFSGLEAYVSAHLDDFPGDLQIQAVPGGFGASVSLPIRIR
jgi:hypothetical protein